MRLCIAVFLVLTASLVAASGVAAVAWGRVFPGNRRPVHRVRLHGWGRLVVAAALCCQLVFGLVVGDIDLRQWGTLTGSGLLLTGLLMMLVSRRPGGRRRDDGMPRP
ncbi:hypothetical protein ABZ918_07385 [Streptomyces viridosporus]|uniref:hypothetical protein n=1 Tax=Streptomyces viridosporus TaxID=67581 RepID=UPI003422B3E6